MTAFCGANIYRCGECLNAVAPSRVRRGDSCPRHPGAETVQGTCERPLAAGRLRCRYHGAQAPQVVQRAAERNVEADVQRLLHEQGWSPVQDPLEALSDLLGEVAATKQAFLDRVDELRSLTVEDSLGREDVRAVLAGYERALDRQGRLLVDAARLGIDERIVTIRSAVESRQANAWADVLETALSETLPPDLADVAKRRFGARLRAQLTGTDLPPLAEVPRYVRVDTIDVTAAPAERPPEPPKALEAAIGPDVPLEAPEPVEQVVDFAPPDPVEPPVPPPDRSPITLEEHQFLNTFGLGIPRREDR